MHENIQTGGKEEYFNPLVGYFYLNALPLVDAGTLWAQLGLLDSPHQDSNLYEECPRHGHQTSECCIWHQFKNTINRWHQFAFRMLFYHPCPTWPCASWATSLVTWLMSCPGVKSSPSVSVGNCSTASVILSLCSPSWPWDMSPKTM